MTTYYQFDSNCKMNLLNKIIQKIKNRPNKVKDQLYDNLNIFDKITLLFKHDHYLLMKLYPAFGQIVLITQLLMTILSIFVYVCCVINAFNTNIFLGFSILTLYIIYFSSIVIHYVTLFNDDSKYDMTDKYLIINYIISIFNFSLPIIIIEFLIEMFIFKQNKVFKNYINKNLEQNFVEHFNTIYYDENNVAYLKHEIINNVSFDHKSNIIYFDYVNKFYDSNTYNINDSDDDQFKRVMTDYIKNHTSRELNFKQLMSKLVYINNLTMLNQSSQNIDQNKKDNELLDQLIDKQVSKDEVLKQQFESFNN